MNLVLLLFADIFVKIIGTSTQLSHYGERLSTQRKGSIVSKPSMKNTGPVDWKEFGTRLMSARIDAGYYNIDEFTDEFVEQTGVTISSRTMRRIEKGAQKPNADTLIGLVGFLKREWPGDFLTNSFINHAKEDRLVFVPVTKLQAVEKLIDLPPLSDEESS